MRIWVQAFCTKTVESALGSIDSHFGSLDLSEMEIELGGVDGFNAERFRETLRVEVASKLPPPLDTCWFSIVHGKPEDRDGCSWDRLTDCQQIQDSVEFIHRTLPTHLSEQSQRRIATVLGETCEIVQSRLGSSEAGTLTGLVAQETGIWLATLGAGLFVVEYDWWFDPQIGEPLR